MDCSFIVMDLRKRAGNLRKSIIWTPSIPIWLKAAGAVGVMINHCEKPMSLPQMKKTIDRARELDFLVFACADTLDEAKAIAQLHPDIINPEPSEIIGGGKGSSPMAYVRVKSTLYEYGNEYIVRGLLSTNDIDELKKAVVKTSANGLPITLDAVADVRIGPKTPVLGVASNDGKPAVLLTVTKQPNTNTLALTGRLDNALDELKANLPADVKVNSQIFRQSRFIDSSIDNVKKSLIEGAIFVIIVLFIFLMNWRTTVISLVSIPLSIVFS